MTLSAEITQVNFGAFEIKGLMDENGDYYVAVTQVADLFQIDSNQASRKVKALLGKGFQFATFKTKLHPKAVNAIPIKEFEKLLIELVLKGNSKAIELSRALIGLSLHQLFSDAFGIQFEIEERHRWLACRFNTKHDFRPLTNQLQNYGFKEPWEYGKFIHAMQAKIGLEDGTRDWAEYEVLNKLERAQTRLTAYMECGIQPYDALKKLQP